MKVVIVGGGLIGLSISWRAALRGVQVTVVEPGNTRAASRVGAGLLIPAGGRISRNHLRLRCASAEMYPAFVAELEEETGLSCGYLACGTMTLAYPPDANQALDGMHNCLRGLGVVCERLSTEQCRELEPALGAEVEGGLLTADHQVDPEKLLAALESACLKRGVEFVHQAAVSLSPTEVCLKNDSVQGDRVVVAAGAWIEELVPLPVYPVKGEVVHLRGPLLLNRNMKLQREDLYVAHRGDGRLVVGASEEEVGFDQTGRARDELLENAYRLLPALKTFELTDHRVGFRPKVADGLPLLGEYKGVLVAGAHYRNGILLTPVTSSLMTELLVSGEQPELMKPFSPEREIKDRREVHNPPITPVPEPH